MYGGWHQAILPLGDEHMPRNGLALTGERDIAYKVLADLLREEILASRDGPDHQLPTEIELVDRHRVSRQTVRRAMQELQMAGLIYRVPGRGTFVQPRTDKYLRSFGSIEDMLALSLDTERRVVQPLGARIDLEAAGRLQLQDDRVMSMTFHRLYQDVVFCVTIVHLPLELGRRLLEFEKLSTPEELSRATVLGVLAQVLDKPIETAQQSITAVRAAPEVAATIGCAVGDPVLRIDRVYFDADRVPVELAINHFNPARYSYRLELRKSHG
jgi:GntR family transcriptional regulator